ncbi:MAG: hypothetical protein D6722_15365 [Bacteroidetes bacterium]|nr:MAG: hypothetical protein D6722_15365 [Bacteroidota bacterium]
MENDFPGSLHVSRCGLPIPAKDQEIWDFAARQGLVVVTFDEDFRDLQAVRGSPPKIIWLPMGNLPSRQLAEKFLAVRDSIQELISNPELDLLEAY